VPLGSGAMASGVGCSTPPLLVALPPLPAAAAASSSCLCLLPGLLL
jgi:hypothetical protein